MFIKSPRFAVALSLGLLTKLLAFPVVDGPDWARAIMIARAAPGQVAASGDYCKSTEYCCPDAKHCLTPTKTSCAKDASVCSADQTCCPLTKLCVTVGAPCASPCKEGNTYCPSRSFTEHLIATKG